MNKDTIGKISRELMIKEMEQPSKHSSHEQMQESLTEYDKNIWECVSRCQQEYPGDFFLVVITKKERLMANVIRNYFFGRQSCPTPEYDQTVYRYDKKGDYVDFLWVIPSKETCQFLINNALIIAPEEREILYFVLAFADGTLFRKAKEFNNEKIDSPLLEF